MTTWLVSVNPNYYDYEKAFANLGYIEYKSVGNNEIGELAYIYINTTYKAIKYKTVVVEVGMAYEETSNYWLSRYHNPSEKQKYSRYKLIEPISDNRLKLSTFNFFGITNPAGGLKIKEDLLLHIESVFAGKADEDLELSERRERFVNTVDVLSSAFPDISVVFDDEKMVMSVKYCDVKISDIIIEKNMYRIKNGWYISKADKTEVQNVCELQNNLFPLEETLAIGQLFQNIERNSENLLRKQCIKDMREVDDYVQTHQLRGTEREIIAKARINQSAFRKGLIARYKSCCMCGISKREVLIASHIKAWADSSAEERIDFDNGLLLCPNHDKLFDRHLISFNETGKIMISKSLINSDIRLLGIDSDISIEISNVKNQYMQYHREIFGKLEAMTILCE
ncbi:MAG: HNH endonuclease [Clostridia bacterium]|nr:HNH endonuclease [Clostridia bacterium]